MSSPTDTPPSPRCPCPRHGAWGFVLKAAVLMMTVALSQAAQAETAAAQGKPQELTIFAAGSLRAALTQITRDFADLTGVRARLVFGASGLLRDRLANGEPADLFASANMEHPQALARAGHALSVREFTRNQLCALSSAAFAEDSRPLAAKLLDAGWRLGISTPKADPSGDYAFEMFERLESTGVAPAGSASALKQRAMPLTGGPQSPPPPSNRNVYGVLVAQGQADVFITYCTNAAIAASEEPQLRVLPIDPSVNIVASYGVATMKGASPEALGFLEHLLGPRGQQRLNALGFAN